MESANPRDSINGEPGVLYNMGYPPETYLKLKSREISFPHNLFSSNPIVLKFSTEHGSNTAVLCAKFQKFRQLKMLLWTNEISRDLNLRCVSHWYPILHSPPGVWYRVFCLSTKTPYVQNVQCRKIPNHFILSTNAKLHNMLKISNCGLGIPSDLAVEMWL